jgi:hypothetical protein
LTYSWALDLAEKGIRVNAISPIARTPMVEANEQLRGIEWQPAHVAPLVTYLMSDEAKAITGRVIRLEGEELSLLSRPGTKRWTTRKAVWDQGTLSTAIPSLITSQVADT